MRGLKTIFCFIVIILLGVVIVAWFFMHSKSKQTVNQPINLPTITNSNVSIEKLSSDYKLKMKELYNNFLNSGDKLDATKKFKQELFDVIVPSEKRDLHLSLVLALDKLETALSANSDTKQIEKEISGLINSL